MAGPNVGHIEVSVDADTGKLKAQLTRAGAEAGKAAKEAAEKELKDLRATIDFQTQDARNEAKILRKRIEAQLHGIPLDVNIREAQAEIIALEEWAEHVNLVLHAQLSKRDVAEINANLREMQMVAESDAINMRIEMDDAAAQARVEALAAQSDEINMRIEVEDIFARASLERLREQEEAEELRLKVEADLTSAALAVFGFRELTESQKLHQIIDVEYETAQMIVATREAKAEIDAAMGELGIRIDPETLEATVDMAVWRAKQEADAIHVPVEPDIDNLEFMASGLGQRLAEAGAAAGDSFGSGFGGGLSTRMRLIIGAVVALAEPLAVLLEGALAASVSVLSSAFAGLASAAGAALPVLIGLAGAGTAAVVGFAGVGDALGAVNEEFAAATAEGRAFDAQAEGIVKALAGLSPAATSFALAFGEVRSQFAEVQRGVEERLFAGLTDELTDLANSVLPSIGGALETAAGSVNRFLVRLADIAQEVDFSGIMAGLTPAVDAVLDGVLALVEALQPFLLAAAPAAAKLAQMFQATAESLADMVRAGAATGGLRQFLLDGLNSLSKWWDLVRNLGDALFTLFQAGKASGDSFVSSLADVVERWDQWMESVEGQEALADFFRTGQQVMADLVPIVEGLQGLFDNLITPGALTRFDSLAESLGEILPVLGSLLELVGRSQIVTVFADLLAVVAAEIERIMPSLQSLADAFGDQLAGALEVVTPLISALATFIGGLASALEPLLPFVTGIVIAFLGWNAIIGIINGVARALIALTSTNPLLAALGITAGILFTVFQHFASSNREISARAAEVADALETQIVAMLDTAEAATAAQLGLDALAQALANAGEDGEKLSTSLGTLGKQLDDSLDVLLSFGEGGENAQQALEELARSAGLTGEGVSELARRVNASDKPFFGVSAANRALAESLGITIEELGRVGAALEEVQDQAKKTDLDQMIRDFLASSAASSDLNEKLLDQAEAHTNLTRTGDDLLALYEDYTNRLFESAAAGNDAAAADAELSAEIDSLVASAEDGTGALVGMTEGLEDTSAETKELREGLLGVMRAIHEMRKVDDVFATMGRNAKALENVFAIGNAAEIADDEIRDIGVAIEELSEKAADVKISDILANSIEADDVLDALAGIRPEIQKQIQDTFATGGAEAAITMANDYITQIQEELGGPNAISREDVAAMLGLDNIEATIVAAVEQASLARAREQLGALAAIEEDRVLSISLDLALSAGQISPEAVTAIVNAQLGDYGVPVGLLPQVTPEAIAEAQAFVNANPLLFPVNFIVDPNAPEVTVPVLPIPGLGFDVALASLFAPGAVVPVTPALDPGFDLATASLFGTGTTIPVTPIPAPDFDVATVSLFAAGAEIFVTPALDPNFDLATASLFAPAGTATKIPVEADTSLFDTAIEGIEDKLLGLDEEAVSPGVEADTSLFDTAIEGIEEKLLGLDEEEVSPGVDADTSLFDTAFEGIEEKLLGLDEEEVSPSVRLDGYTVTNERLDTLDEKLTDLDAMIASATVTLPGITQRIEEVRTLDSEIDGLRSRSITITTNRVSTGEGGMAGGVYGSMAGELIGGPTMRAVGELGYREAIIPLELPLNRVNPEVRALAALLRGGGENDTGTVIQKQINQSLTVVTPEADPVAVATQVLNRTAAMANV